MSRRVEVVEGILSANDHLAAQNRERLEAAGVFSVNVMASPGAGKTSLIERTAEALGQELRLAVIDGDLATSPTPTAAGPAPGPFRSPAASVISMLPCPRPRSPRPSRVDLLLVENVGNSSGPTARSGHLGVCRLGPRSDDKLIYRFYHSIDVVLLNKIDLLPYVAFDVQRFLHGVEVLNPALQSFLISCTTGEGLDAWFGWLRREAARRQALRRSLSRAKPRGSGQAEAVR
jgi:hydrogenase nickel incorporation protein HypB